MMMELNDYQYENATATLMFSHEEIQERVETLAHEIDAYYEAQGIEEIVLIGVLKGAFVFLADLVRHLKTNVVMDFIQVQSYEGTESTGNVQFLQDVRCDVKGKNLLFVEDIVDTGYTLQEVRTNFQHRGAGDFKLVAMFDKAERRLVDLQADFVGFEIPDKFVIGYGLDFDEKYRQLPFVAELKLK